MNIGIVGLGGMGINHYNAYSFIPEARVCAIADTSAETLQKKINEKSINFYTELLDMLESENLDVIDICVPSYLHYEYVVKCIERGKNVICEKPLAHSVQEAEEIVRLEKINSVKVFVGQILRFWPEYNYLKEAIYDKRFGDIHFVNFHRYYGMHPAGSWYLNSKLCKMVCYEMHIHDTDMVNYLFGLPRFLQSTGVEIPSNHLSYINTHYYYDSNKTSIVAQGGWNDSIAPFTGGYRAVFSKGVLDYKDGNLIVYPSKGDPHKIRFKEYNSLIPADLYPVVNELRNFIGSLLGDICAKSVTSQDAMNTLHIIEKEQLSMKTRKIEYL